MSLSFKKPKNCKYFIAYILVWMISDLFVMLFSYALYRDEKEIVHNNLGTLLGCVMLACEELYELPSFEVRQYSST